MSEVKSITLSPSQTKVLLKSLSILAPSYSEIEIKEGRICNKSDDKVVTYKLDLPLPEQFEISFVSLPNILKYFKDFAGSQMTVFYTDTDYIVRFEETGQDGNLEELATFKLKKPDIITNEYNYEKIQNLEGILEFKPITEDLALLNRIRVLSARFKNDVVVNLKDKKIEIHSADKNVTFSKDIDLEESSDFKFKILQHALPVVDLQEHATLSYATTMHNNQEIVVYKLESIIDVAGHDVPITIYGTSIPLRNTQDELLEV